MNTSELIERIVREEVRNYLFATMGSKQRKRKPVEVGYVQLAADPSQKGLTPARKDTFVSKVADLQINKFLELKVPKNISRLTYIKRVEASVGYCRKRTGYTLSCERQDDGIRVYRTA